MKSAFARKARSFAAADCPIGRPFVLDGARTGVNGRDESRA